MHVQQMSKLYSNSQQPKIQIIVKQLLSGQHNMLTIQYFRQVTLNGQRQSVT